MKKFLYIFFLHLAIIFYSQSYYNYKLYDSSSGFANSVNDITKDESGMVWLSTDEGLWKFDGYNFINFKSKYWKQTGKSVLKAITFKNKVYVVYKNNGCTELNTDTGEEKLITTEEVNDVSVERQQVFFLLKSLTILILRNSERVLYNTGIKTKFSGFEKVSFCIKNKIIYLSVPHSGFYKIVNNNVIKYQIKDDAFLPGGVFGESFKNIGEDIYYAGLKYPIKITEKNISPITLKDVQFYRINDFTFFNHQLYFIKDSKSLLTFDVNTQKATTLLDIDNIELKKILIDQNSIYVVTNQGLLEINKKQDYISHINDDINKDHFRVRRKILNTKEGNYLFGYPDILLYKNQKNLKQLETSTFSIYDAVKTKDGFLLGTEGKGLLFADNQFKKINTVIFNEESDKHVCTVQYDSINNIFYAGDYHHLYKIQNLNTPQQKIIMLPNLFSGKMIKSIEIDYQYKRIWVGTDGGLFLVDLNNLKYLNFSIKDKIIGDILIDKNKEYLYFGDEKGLTILRLKDLKIVKQIFYNFLYNPKVSALLEDDEGRIWASTFSGIVGSDLKHNVNIYLQKRNGLLNTEYNYKAKAILDKSKIIFGGLNGYDIVDTHKFAFIPINRKGTISGYQLLGNDTLYKKTPTDNVIHYKRDHYFARIYFTVPSNLNRGSCNFDYRINKGNWVSIKDLYHIDLVGMYAGNYNLEMRGFDEFGRLISFNPIRIEVREDFLNSNLFLYFIFGFLFLTLLFIFVFIIYTKKKQYQILEKVSMDLHEELGSLINKSNMILKKINIEGDEKSSINNLKRYINQASYSLRIFINDIKSKEYKLTDLYYEIYELYDASIEFKNVKIEFNKNFDTSKYIDSNLYRDIKLSLYELNNNFIKYSKANYLIINFVQDYDTLLVEVKEKNCSEELGDIVEKGNGLKNITKRITRNKGSFTYVKEEKGINFIIKVKI